MFFFKRKHLDTQEAILHTQNEILNELKQLNEHKELMNKNILRIFGKYDEGAEDYRAIYAEKYEIGQENAYELLKEIRDQTKVE